MIAWLLANWKLPASAVAGALMCAPLTYCAGSNAGKASANARIELAAEKVRTAAAKAESAANLADMARRAKTTEQVRELKEISHEVGTSEMAGPGTRAVLARLRSQAARGDDAAR